MAITIANIRNGVGDFWEARSQDGYLLASATTESEVRALLMRDAATARADHIAAWAEVGGCHNCDDCPPDPNGPPVD